MAWETVNLYGTTYYRNSDTGEFTTTQPPGYSDRVVDVFGDTTAPAFDFTSSFIPTTQIDYSPSVQEVPTVSSVADKYGISEGSAEQLMPLVQAQIDAQNTLTSIVAPAQASYWTSPEGQAAQQEAISDITSGKVNIMDEIAWGAGTLDNYGVNAGLKNTLENTAGYDQAWQNTADLGSAVTGAANLLRSQENQMTVAGIPLETVAMLVGDLASGGMMSAAKNITQGIKEGDIGQVVQGIAGAGISLNAKDIKAMKEAADAAAVSGDWVKAAELSREIDSLQNVNSVLKTGEALAMGNYGSALLSGAPLVGVDPVGSVTESLFGQDPFFDDLNNYKFGGGFDVSAASEGIVQAGGALLDTGGDLEAALQKGLLTYAREGGSMPDLASNGIFTLPNIDLGINLPNIPFPDITLPDVNLPDLSLPDINIPDISLPDVTLPDINIPDLSLPDVTLPDINVPDISLPDVTLPDISLPDVTLPDVTLPDVTLPDLSVNTPQFSSPEFSSLDGSIDLPSLDLNLPDSANLEGIVTSPKWKKTANIGTTATLLQKMTPKERIDYLDLLLRSMQA